MIVIDDFDYFGADPGGFKPFPPGVHLTHGRGGRCWDQYGNAYIDFICANGPLVLGHCNTEVNQAVIDQMYQGTLLPSNSTPIYEEFVSVLKTIFPHVERVRCTKTGSEAIAGAIRLARAHTGRNKIIRCGFHGWHDQLVSPHEAWHQYEANIKPPTPVTGVPALKEHPVLSWDGEDIQQLKDLYKKNQSCIAGFLLDPVQLRDPLDQNLKELKKLAHEEGALFILDEVKTGFRVSLGGVQQLYNVQADLTLLGKAVANGFPLSIILGSAKIMDLADSLKISGTFSNELLSIAASLKTISILKESKNMKWISQVGQRLIEGTNDILNRYRLLDDVQAVPYRWPCMPYIWFRKASKTAQKLKPLFYKHLLQRGVLMLAYHMNYTCLAHSKKDIEETLQSIEDALNSNIYH